MKRPLALAAFLALAGCQPTSQMPTITDDQARVEVEKQRELVAAEQNNLEHRARNVWFRIVAANAELCGEHTVYSMGFASTRSDLIGSNYRVAMNILYGVDDQRTMIYTYKGSPADVAGLQPRDKLVSIDGQEVTDKVMAALMRAGGAPVRLDIIRAGQPMVVTVQPVKVCDWPLKVETNDAVNAWADGTSITVTSGMMHFVQSDDELALIIGHEMGHDNMGHMEKKRANALVGAIVDGVVAGLTRTPNGSTAFQQAGAGAFSQDFEREADYVGTYYAARAGYDITAATELWRRMAATHPAGIHLEGGTHPSTAKRVLAEEDTAREIERKEAAGQPLVPEQKQEGAP